MQKNKIDVIVVGAGPAGVSAGVTLARAGKKVLIIERGTFAGSKNVFGGAIYIQPTKEIFPNLLEEAPIERINTEHRYALLTKDNATVISYKAKETTQNSCTVLRAKFDRWCVEQAKKEGAYFAPETLVKELIVNKGQVIGVKTDLEDYYADLVIVADGVNSLLAKQVGLRDEIKPKNVALAVKEVIKVDKEKLEERFNLTETSGCIYETIGYPMDTVLGLGYVYTNKESVVVGLGIGLGDLKKQKLKAYEVLNDLKKHPSIAPLIKGGELIEYSAHLIPEGGYKKIPKLYGNGVMLVGDSAMLVNNVHWEGTNLALMSGKMAAETAIEAIEKQDFSENALSLYQQKMENSFVLNDMKTYRDVIGNVAGRTSSFFGYYPGKIAEFFEVFTAVNSKPKKEEFRRFIGSIFTDRSIRELIKDGWTIFKTVVGVLK